MYLYMHKHMSGYFIQEFLVGERFLGQQNYFYGVVNVSLLWETQTPSQKFEKKAAVLN